MLDNGPGCPIEYKQPQRCISTCMACCLCFMGRLLKPMLLKS